MQDITIRHEMDCDEDTYWFKCVFDVEYNESLYLKELQFPQYELAKYEEDATSIRRTVKVSPKIPPMPAPVRKVIGEGLAYVEVGTFDRATKRYTFTATPNALGDKAKTSGVMFVETLGPKKIARVAKVSVDVKVFMVGSLIEDQILNSLRASYDHAAKFTNEYVKAKGY